MTMYTFTARLSNVKRLKTERQRDRERERERI